MGFSDTMKGIGRALGGALESIAEIAGPPLIQAGTQAAVSWIQSKATPAPAYGYGYQAPYAPGGGIVQQPTVSPTVYQPRGAAVPSSWTPIGSAAPAIYTPQAAPAYGYQPASMTSDIINLGSQYLFGNGGITAMPEFEGSPGTTGGGLLTEAYERLSGLVGGQTSFYRYGTATARPIPEIQVKNPVTGKIAVWKYMGRPILYSGDLAACRRVNRVARRVARRRPR